MYLHNTYYCLILVGFQIMVLSYCTDAPKWVNYIDLRQEFDDYGIFYTRLYDKRDDFDFLRVNVPYFSSNIPEFAAYGVFASQLIQHMKIFCSDDLNSGFKVIEAGIFFTETLDYFSEIIWSSYIHCSQIWHVCVAFVEAFVHQLWHMTGFQLF